MLGVTIRMGAADYSVRTPDGAVFDLSKMSQPARNKLTRMLRDVYALHLEKNGRKETAKVPRRHARRRGRVRLGPQA